MTCQIRVAPDDILTGPPPRPLSVMPPTAPALTVMPPTDPMVPPPLHLSSTDLMPVSSASPAAFSGTVLSPAGLVDLQYQM